LVLGLKFRDNEADGESMGLATFLRQAWDILTYNQSQEIIDRVRARGPYASVLIGGGGSRVVYHQGNRGTSEPKVQPTLDSGEWYGVFDGAEGGIIEAAEHDGGWLVSVLLDSEGGGFCMLGLTDDGPYDSEPEAMQAGRDYVSEWLIDNGLPLPEEETDML
jgi:hypothetical protein